MELDITGEEHVWSDRPCVFVFNHQSSADMLVLAALLRRDMAGVGKKEIRQIPILGRVIEYAGTVLIDRENTASAVEAMQPLVDAMRNEGRCVCMAPEGTRSTSTHLGRFKKGAFHLAMQAGVPMVPIVIHNSIDVSPRGQFVMRPATVKVDVLPPIDTSNWSAETIDEHVEFVRDLFLIELDQMVLQQPSLPANSPNLSTPALEQAKRTAKQKPVKAIPRSALKKTGLQTKRPKAKAPAKVSAQVVNRGIETLAATVSKSSAKVRKKTSKKKTTARKK
jgi:putative phosphoserine phosphatase/1-acylglycerol-3-phosphate O-acyltransferase